MKDFLIANWRVLCLALIALVNTTLLILKKCKVVQKDTIFEQLLERLPTMIRSAEKQGVSGAEKKAVVMAYALNWLSSMKGVEVKDYADRISNMIELILSTPQKKGVCEDE